LKRFAIAALRKQFEATRPGVPLSPSGYVANPERNLVAGVGTRHLVRDFEQGDGRELERKFLAVHSSAALAVNTFAPFKDCPDQLSLAGIGDFETMEFEARCPIGLRGGRPAHLDLLAQGRAGVVAAESKCTEHLDPKVPAFSPAYAEQILDERRAGPWFRARDSLLTGQEKFEFLDAAQLIKHAFGLARRFPLPVTLLYLYWEPRDGARHASILAHRTEITGPSDHHPPQVSAGGDPGGHARSRIRRSSGLRRAPSGRSA
jgi:hypothetical protein